MHTSRMIALAIGLTVGLTAPALAQDKVVRVWHTETEPQTIKAFNDIARRFEAKNPGVKIEAEGLAWGDLEGKIMASLAAGSAAGVVARPADHLHGAAIEGPAAARSTRSSRRSARAISGSRSSASATSAASSTASCTRRERRS